MCVTFIFFYVVVIYHFCQRPDKRVPVKQWLTSQWRLSITSVEHVTHLSQVANHFRISQHLTVVHLAFQNQPKELLLGQIIGNLRHSFQVLQTCYLQNWNQFLVTLEILVWVVSMALVVKQTLQVIRNLQHLIIVISPLQKGQPFMEEQIGHQSKWTSR